jgi:alkaline phosphatase D
MASEPSGPTTLTRRSALAAGAAAAVLLTDVRAAHASPLHTDPFTLGVASGDPLADSVILWTRLAGPDGAELTGGDVEVSWELADDPAFRHLVRRGPATARRGTAHAVHVDVRGLRPGRDYWYRFRAGRYLSAAGRTRSAPAPWERPSSLLLAGDYIY